MMSLALAHLPALLGGVLAISALTYVYFSVRNSGRTAQQSADMKEELSNVATRGKIDAEVAGESDAAVADDLRRQSRR